MKQVLCGKPALTEKQRKTLTDNAISLAIERNGVLEVMSKCVIVRSYRELWVLSSEHPQGQRLI